MEACLRLVNVLGYCAKGLDFVGYGKLLEFVILCNDIGLCFRNMIGF